VLLRRVVVSKPQHGADQGRPGVTEMEIPVRMPQTRTPRVRREIPTGIQMSDAIH
jgi:hypothetical protein